MYDEAKNYKDNTRRGSNLMFLSKDLGVIRLNLLGELPPPQYSVLVAQGASMWLAHFLLPRVKSLALREGARALIEQAALLELGGWSENMQQKSSLQRFSFFFFFST